MKHLYLAFMLSVFYTGLSGQPVDSVGNTAIRYYARAGLQWSGHAGVDASVSFVAGKHVVVSSRLWFSDYATKSKPKISGCNSFSAYPYSHEEFALLGGWYQELSDKRWFFTAEAGPSYVRYFYPVEVVRTIDTNGAEITSYNRKMVTAGGVVLTGSINWHYTFFAVGLSPQYFANHLHSYGAVTASVYFYLP